jgi:hypothetical protein
MDRQIHGMKPLEQAAVQSHSSTLLTLLFDRYFILPFQNLGSKFNAYLQNCIGEIYGAALWDLFGKLRLERFVRLAVVALFHYRLPLENEFDRL